MIASDELAAVVAALQILATQTPELPELKPSRWKVAARQPELEIEDLRVR